MVFSSITFLFYFLPLVLFCYYLVPYKLKNFILLIFSLIFYAYGEPIYIFIMLFSCVVDYINALIIDKYRNTYKAKLALIFSIIINLSLLAFFKYSDFFISIVNSLTNYNIPLLNITLPIGISFYTFQTMSYTIDVYRNEAPIQKNIFSLSAFVTLFPQLVAGPIVRYSDVSYDLNHRIHNFDKFYDGVYRFIIGLCKKVILANNLGVIWYSIKATPYDTLSLATSWLGIICFTLQIYFDFSGYSDMAIGLGKIFGFDFLENFNFPYISKSITEFWRRWHISLGSFFRDYVYIPLGGNRKRQLLNIFVVWFLTGFWHGASWNFIIWGLYFGTIVYLEKRILFKLTKKVPDIIKWLFTMILVVFGWAIFYYVDFDSLIIFSKSLFGLNNNPLYSNTLSITFMNNIIFILISIVASTPVPSKVFNILKNKKILTIDLDYIQIVFNIVLIFCSISLLVGESYNPFLYYRF